MRVGAGIVTMNGVQIEIGTDTSAGRAPPFVHGWTVANPEHAARRRLLSSVACNSIFAPTRDKTYESWK